MKLHTIFFTLCLALAALSCNQKTKNSANSTPQDSKIEHLDNAHSSENALDWDGFYQGVMPCADCSGIDTNIILNANKTFTITTKYLGKEDNISFTETGVFSWNIEGSTITLNTKRPQQFFVGENVLMALDMDGNKITGSLSERYNLHKKELTLKKTHWLLTEISGEKINTNSAFILFNREDSTVFGNSSCNNFTGTYSTDGTNSITLNSIAATLKACPDLNLENKFLPLLETITTYSITLNVLSLSNGKGEKLATFTADFSKNENKVTN